MCHGKNNRGFTLIELLAVIVILAVIALIAMPIILGLIENSQKEAFKDTAYGLIDAAKYYAMKSSPTGADLEKQFIIESKAFVGDSLTLNGSLPNQGYVGINQKMQIEVYIKNDKWCVYKLFGDASVSITSDMDLCVKEYVPDIPLTPESCFYTSGNTILGYYNYQGNNSSNPACPKEINIPEVINSNTITTIGSTAFFGKQLKTVIMPNTVTAINSQAFQNNLLTTVILSKNLITIGNHVFYQNASLANITIPNKVTSIGVETFRECGLKKITIPSSVTTIDNYAFYNNQITTITLSNGLVTIGNSAFRGNKVVDVTIPSSVTTISDFAFSQTAATWQTVTVKGNGTNAATRFDSIKANLGWASVTIQHVTE